MTDTVLSTKSYVLDLSERKAVRLSYVSLSATDQETLYCHPYFQVEVIDKEEVEA
jgi:hypothetical protein